MYFCFRLDGNAIESVLFQIQIMKTKFRKMDALYPLISQRRDATTDFLKDFVMKLDLQDTGKVLLQSRKCNKCCS